MSVCLPFKRVIKKMMAKKYKIKNIAYAIKIKNKTFLLSTTKLSANQ